MKTLNFFIKRAAIGLTFFCIGITSTGAYESPQTRVYTQGDSIIELLTREVRSKVNLSEARNIFSEPSRAVVKIIINNEGRAIVSEKSANDAEFENYLTEKLSEINLEFPEEYYGKALIYRFSLI